MVSETEKTEVGEIPGSETIKGNTIEWMESTALSVFYQYIIPSGEGATSEQRTLQNKLIPWLAGSYQWAEGERDHDPATFKQINNSALQTLLNSSLKQLNENSTSDTESGSFTTAFVEYQDDEGNTKKRKIQYGARLKNKPGISFEEPAKVNQMREHWMKALRALKEKDAEEGFDKFFTDVDLQVAENHIKELDKPQFDDDVLLKDVLPPVKPAAQRFYQLYSLSPDEKSEAAIVLGKMTLTGIIDLTRQYKSKEKKDDKGKTITRTVDGEEQPVLETVEIEPSAEKKAAFLQQWGVEWKEVAKEIDGLQKKYGEIMGTGLKEGEETRKVSLEELLKLLQEDGEEVWPVKVMTSSIEDKKGSIDEQRESVSSKEIDNVEELEEWVEGASQEELRQTLKMIADKWYAQASKEHRGKFGRIEVELDEAVRTEDDLSDKPVRGSPDDYENLLKRDVKFLDLKNLIDYPGHIKTKRGKLQEGKTSKTTQKIGIHFKNLPIDIDKLYASKVGTSEKMMTGKRRPKQTIYKKGVIRIQHEQIIPDSIKKLTPVFTAREDYKLIRNVLTSFLRKTKTQTLGVEGALTNQYYEDLEKTLEYLHHIQTNPILDEVSEEIGLEEFDLDNWVNENGDIKWEREELIEELNTNTLEGKANPLQRDIQKLYLIILKFAELTADYQLNEELRIQEEEDDEDDEKEEEAGTEETDAQREAREAREASEIEEAREGTAEGDADEGGLSVTSTGQLRGIEDEEDVEITYDDIDWDDDASEKEFLEYISDIELDHLDNLATKMGEIENLVNEGLKLTNIKPSSDQYIKKFRKFVRETLNYDEGQEKAALQILKDSATIQPDDEEGKDAIMDLREQIGNAWEVKSQEADFREPKKEDYDKIIRELDIPAALAKAFANNAAFNDLRNGGVTLNPTGRGFPFKKLWLVLDFTREKIKLSGSVSWKAEYRNVIEHKIRQQSGRGRTAVAPPFVSRAHGAEPSKTILGLSVTGAGEEQIETHTKGSRAGQPYDETRFDFFKEIQSRTVTLIQAVKGA
tara:strand:- start:1534 stop:4635 length:3102 start_codon:yes stop_codon:yes gene_type:complete